MNENINNNTILEEEPDFDFKKLKAFLILNVHWILLSVVTCFLVAYIYLWFTPTKVTVEGTIEGILRDFVKCTREQTLMGNTVKVDDLAIFKVSVIGNGCAKLYDKDSDKTISASLGSLYNPKTHQNDLTGPAVASLKLLAQATGEYTRDELNKVAKLGWTDAAAKQIAEAKAAELGGGSSTGSETAGDNTQGGGSTDTGGGSTIPGEGD